MQVVTPRIPERLGSNFRGSGALVCTLHVKSIAAEAKAGSGPVPPSARISFLPRPGGPEQQAKNRAQQKPLKASCKRSLGSWPHCVGIAISMPPGAGSP